MKILTVNRLHLQPQARVPLLLLAHHPALHLLLPALIALNMVLTSVETHLCARVVVGQTLTVTRNFLLSHGYQEKLAIGVTCIASIILVPTNLLIIISKMILAIKTAQ